VSELPYLIGYFSKNQKGTFHLRIEDTDKERSKEEHKIQIINSLNWLGIRS
jgi:glutamyl-tRNA synthetase